MSDITITTAGGWAGLKAKGKAAMSLFDGDGRNRGLAGWVGPTLSGLALAGGLVAVYVGLQSQNAVHDERIRALETRMAEMNVDHVMLNRIDVRLSNIEAALSDRTRPPRSTP